MAMIGLFLAIIGIVVVLVSAIPGVMSAKFRIPTIIVGLILIVVGFAYSNGLYSPQQPTQQFSPTPAPEPQISVSQLNFVSPSSGVTIKQLTATIPLQYNATQITKLGSDVIPYKSLALVKETFVVQRTDTLTNASVWQITVSTPSYLNTTSGQTYPYIYMNSTTTYAIGINGVWGSPTYLFSLPAAGSIVITVAFYLNYNAFDNLNLGQSVPITIMIGNQQITDTFVITGTGVY
jgi:hypothetical protein